MSDKENIFIFGCEFDPQDIVLVEKATNKVHIKIEEGGFTSAVLLKPDDALGMAKALVKLAFEVKHEQGQEIPVQPLSSKRITVPDVFWKDNSMTVSSVGNNGVVFFNVEDKAIAIDKFQVNSIANWMLRQTGEETVSD